MSNGWGGRRAQQLTALVLARDDYRCRMPTVDGSECGAVATTADHVVPIAEGGALWDPANMRAACGPHNFSAGGTLANQRRLSRLTLPPSRDW